MTETVAITILHDQVKSQEQRLTLVEERTDAIPTLSQKVDENTKAVTRMTTAIYSAGTIVVAAACGVIFFGPA